MKYTIQPHTDSGNFAAPFGDQSLSHCRSRAECHGILQDWQDTVCRYGDAPVSALVWKGFYDDTTDVYPDFELTFGPRGGIVWNPC